MGDAAPLDWPCLCSRGPRPPPAQPMSSLLRPAIHMTWRDLSFMHWRVDPDALRPLIPEPLEVDLFGGEAWVGVVPFEMRGTRLWPLPTVPGLRHFPELNLRTYVRHGDRQGVWFFSLDACSKVAVRVARQTFALPYLDARMSIEREPGAGEDGWIRYSSQRRDAFGAPRREGLLWVGTDDGRV
ncbi:MAG: YqjF family protein, partial [Planctomycetota bacterium]